MAESRPLRRSARARIQAESGLRGTGRNAKPSRSLRAYLYIGAAFLYLVVFVLYPMGDAIWLSLTSTQLLSPNVTPFVGVRNYDALFTTGGLTQVLGVSAIFVVIVTAGSMVCGVAAALLVESLRVGRASVRTLLALPWTIPGVVIALLFALILDARIGVLNRVLGLAHVSPVPWINVDSLALWSVAAVTVWNLFPFVMLVTIAALQAVPAELYDAAAVDGARYWRMTRRITLPSIAPTIKVIGLFIVIWALQQFQVIWIMTQGGPINGTNILSIALYRTAFLDDNLGPAAAIGVIALIPSLAFTALYFRLAGPLRDAR